MANFVEILDLSKQEWKWVPTEVGVPLYRKRNAPKEDRVENILAADSNVVCIQYIEMKKEHTKWLYAKPYAVFKNMAIRFNPNIFSPNALAIEWYFKMHSSGGDNPVEMYMAGAGMCETQDTEIIPISTGGQTEISTLSPGVKHRGGILSYLAEAIVFTGLGFKTKLIPEWYKLKQIFVSTNSITYSVKEEGTDKMCMAVVGDFIGCKETTLKWQNKTYKRFFSVPDLTTIKLNKSIDDWEKTDKNFSTVALTQKRAVNGPNQWILREAETNYVLFYPSFTSLAHPSSKWPETLTTLQFGLYMDRVCRDYIDLISQDDVLVFDNLTLDNFAVPGFYKDMRVKDGLLRQHEVLFPDINGNNTDLIKIWQNAIKVKELRIDFPLYVAPWFKNVLQILSMGIELADDALELNQFPRKKLKNNDGVFAKTSPSVNKGGSKAENEKRDREAATKTIDDFFKEVDKTESAPHFKRFCDLAKGFLTQINKFPPPGTNSSGDYVTITTVDPTITEETAGNSVLLLTTKTQRGPLNGVYLECQFKSNVNEKPKYTYAASDNRHITRPKDIQDMTSRDAKLVFNTNTSPVWIAMQRIVK